jgi:hypothetical protein
LPCPALPCPGAGLPSPSGEPALGALREFREPSPARGILTAVTATSATSAWAVGYSTGTETAIVEHWNGTAWTWPAGVCEPDTPGCHGLIR